MSDEQQQQPEQSQQDAPYPHFPATQAGLMALHRELGRLFHLSLEAEARAGEDARKLQHLARAARVLTTKHAPGMCAPVEDEAADDIPSVAEAVGVPEDAIEVVPTPMTATPRRARGG